MEKLKVVNAKKYIKKSGTTIPEVASKIKGKSGKPISEQYLRSILSGKLPEGYPEKIKDALKQIRAQTDDLDVVILRGDKG